MKETQIRCFYYRRKFFPFNPPNVETCRMHSFFECFSFGMSRSSASPCSGEGLEMRRETRRLPSASPCPGDGRAGEDERKKNSECVLRILIGGLLKLKKSGKKNWEEFSGFLGKKSMENEKISRIKKIAIDRKTGTLYFARKTSPNIRGCMKIKLGDDFQIGRIF